jgi:hypothetical protein
MYAEGLLCPLVVICSKVRDRLALLAVLICENHVTTERCAANQTL